MEGDSDSMYRAGIELAAVAAAAAASAPAVTDSQSFGYATVRSDGLDNASDHCMSIPEIDDSRLVGVPATGRAVAVEVKSASAAVAAMNVVGSGEKRKRGRPAKGMTPAKPPAPPKIKMEEEDVCFICFDGGSLVLCDRKGCPKAYHPACIKRDEAFFRSKAKWNCGWHICSVCQKAAHCMCYTCTYSLCKGCSKDADFLCVRGNMGFCTTCMRTIMLIENKDQANMESVQVDFDDKFSWEYLFKVYWILLKEKLSLTLDELTKAKNPWKGAVSVACKQQLPDAQHVVLYSNGFLSNGPLDRSRSEKPKEQDVISGKPCREETTEKASIGNGASLSGHVEWASRELLEFVAHMKNGDTSVLSQFDVQALLLEYIKKNNLRDPRRKSQIICDLRLKNLFGKPCVGHIEMLKLLEFHFLIKEDSLKNAFIPAGIVGNDSGLLGHDYNNGNSQLENKNRRRKTRKKIEERAPQNDLEEFAAIDVHNMNLIYLRRNLMENLIEDEKFHDKVVGSIVRIRISSSDQKQDLYRLVKVVGTAKVAVPYKIGEKTLDVMLEVLNLNKKETIAIDAISNQEFSEDECRRLRQSIRCGLVRQLTVGEIQKKAMELQAVRLNDWLEEEMLKLNHLRDRASEQGRKKELRECIEKLQLLKTPEERQRRLCEIPEVHADPKMNPDYESEEDAGGVNYRKQDAYIRPKHSGFSSCGNKLITSKRKVKEEGLVLQQRRVNQRRVANGLSDQAIARSGPEAPTAATLATSSSLSTSDGETEKLWHYRDPTGKIQGPFSMMQLRKWSTTGYFPPDMRIWTINEQDDSVLLTDALIGNFHTAAHLLYNFSLQCQQLGATSDHQIRSSVGWNENMNRLGNSKPIVVALQCSSARVQSNNNNEFVRTDVLSSISSGSSTSVVGEKERQPGILQHWELKDKNSCSDHSQECHLPPSSNIGVRQVAVPHEGQSRGSEGSRSSPYLENKVSSRGAAYQIPDAQYENQSNCSSSVQQSSGQNWRSFPINLNSDIMDTNHGFSPVTKSDSSELDGNVDLGFPSPTPKDSIWESSQVTEKLLPVSSDVPAQVSNMQDPPSPTPKPTNENQAELAESKQPTPAKVAGQDSGPSWSSASSLVVGGAQLPEIADECRYSPTPAKPSVEEWSSGLVSVSSLKQPEVVGDHATPTSNIDPLAHASPSHPTSNWHMGFEPIEFSTLAEESVSDLLAEVDAMESQSGLASPTSAVRCGDEMMKGCKNYCFTIEDLSPDPGKSDDLSTTGDIQLPCQSTVTDEPVGASQADAYDPSRRSSGHSTTSSEGETKSAGIPAYHGEAGSTVHPHSSHSMSQEITGTTTPQSTAVTAMDNVWGRLPGHVSLDWGASAQGIPNAVWSTSQGAPWGNPNVNHGAFSSGMVWDGQWTYSGERYTAPRDSVQNGELTHSKGRPFWNRPPQKGQRVCKFHESGHCKKGASCDYLHPYP